MVYASTPAKANPTEAGRKRVYPKIPTYTEEGRKRVRQNREFPEARQVRFDDEAAAAAQEVVAKVPSRAACRQEEGRRVIDRSASQMVHASTPAKAHPQRDRNTEVGRKRVCQETTCCAAAAASPSKRTCRTSGNSIPWRTLLRPTSVLRSRCGWALAGLLASTIFFAEHVVQLQKNEHAGVFIIRGENSARHPARNIKLFIRRSQSLFSAVKPKVRRYKPITGCGAY